MEPPAPSPPRQRPVDVALLGLEPELPGEAVPQVPKDYVEAELAVSASTRLAAAAGLTSAELRLAASQAQTVQLVPGVGDASSWRSYVAGFQGLAVVDRWSFAGAYLLVEAVLSTPLHVELCVELARYCAGSERSSLLSTVGLGARSGSWGNAAAPTAQQLLRQRNAVGALKALGQTLLCRGPGLESAEF